MVSVYLKLNKKSTQINKIVHKNLMLHTCKCKHEVHNSLIYSYRITIYNNAAITAPKIGPTTGIQE